MTSRAAPQAQASSGDRAQPAWLPPGIAAVLSVLSAAAVVLDSEDRVLTASAAALSFGLVKADELAVPDLLALVRQVRRNGEIREGEMEISASGFGGSTTSFAVRVAPLGAGLGGGGLVLLLAEDQTESRRVDEVRRDFVANTSHELKTPVGALALLAETVEDAADDPEAVRRFAGRMRHEAARLTNLVQDLITLNRSATVSRLVAGVFHELNNSLQVIGGLAELLQDTPGIPTTVADGLRRIHEQNAKAGVAIAEVMAFSRQKTDERDRVNMRDLTTRAVRLRAFAIGRARLTIVYQPPKIGVVDVQGFTNLLLQVVLNLIVNAEQALAGTQGGTIRVELESPAGWVVVRVSDNGPGVDPAVADRLFEPFVTTRSRDESSGLGLAVARQIAEQHGGTLTIERVDTGACFAMRLPAVI